MGIVLVNSVEGEREGRGAELLDGVEVRGVLAVGLAITLEGAALEVEPTIVVSRVRGAEEIVTSEVVTIDSVVEFDDTVVEVMKVESSEMVVTVELDDALSVV